MHIIKTAFKLIKELNLGAHLPSDNYGYSYQRNLKIGRMLS